MPKKQLGDYNSERPDDNIYEENIDDYNKMSESHKTASFWTFTASFLHLFDSVFYVENLVKLSVDHSKKVIKGLLSRLERVKTNWHDSGDKKCAKSDKGDMISLTIYSATRSSSRVQYNYAKWT